MRMKLCKTNERTVTWHRSTLWMSRIRTPGHITWWLRTTGARTSTPFIWLSMIRRKWATSLESLADVWLHCFCWSVCWFMRWGRRIVASNVSTAIGLGKLTDELILFNFTHRDFNDQNDGNWVSGLNLLNYWRSGIMTVYSINYPPPDKRPSARASRAHRWMQFTRHPLCSRITRLTTITTV